MKQELNIVCVAPVRVVAGGIFSEQVRQKACDDFAVDLINSIDPNTTELHFHCSNPFDNLLGCVRFFNLCKEREIPLISLDFGETVFDQFSAVIKKLICSIPPTVTLLNLSSCELGENNPVRKLSIICEFMPKTIKTLNLAGNKLDKMTVNDIFKFDPFKTLSDLNVILSDDEIFNMTDKQRQELIDVLIPTSPGLVFDKIKFVDSEGILLDIAKSKAIPLIEAAQDEFLFGCE